ncbi:hypothetical protein IscW_ISCW014882 [Ixodes scapularis]|uniref:Uncharacterized protein n=1 Tax=Ixodes scapularis TaxID=6945 RepID=B7QHH9_IXOSC|nr:hypothetical protein IscW_ISCW014882 [Ixodes scapularis]|eukprot:XP_002414636.1 hypothetical protein IscW_ISCW014882 [Ixodes scapularis]
MAIFFFGKEGRGQDVAILFEVENEEKWPRFGSPARGDVVKRRGNENHDAACLIGLVGCVLWLTSFPKKNKQQSVRDIAVRVTFLGFCIVPTTALALFCKLQISVQNPFNW